MGAGRAAAFNDETTDLGSVSGRSSGPVEAAIGGHTLQQETINSANNSRLRIMNLFSNDVLTLRVEDVALGVMHHRLSRCSFEQLIYHGFSDPERPPAWRMAAAHDSSRHAPATNERSLPGKILPAAHPERGN